MSPRRRSSPPRCRWSPTPPCSRRRRRCRASRRQTQSRRFPQKGRRRAESWPATRSGRHRSSAARATPLAAPVPTHTWFGASTVTFVPLAAKKPSFGSAGGSADAGTRRPGAAAVGRREDDELAVDRIADRDAALARPRRPSRRRTPLDPDSRTARPRSRRRPTSCRCATVRRRPMLRTNTRSARRRRRCRGSRASRRLGTVATSASVVPPSRRPDDGAIRPTGPGHSFVDGAHATEPRVDASREGGPAE